MSSSELFRERRRHRLQRNVVLILAGGLAIVFATIVTFPSADVAVHAPRARTGLEVAVALSCLFAALVLVLFPMSRDPQRVRIAAVAIALIGGGALVIGVLLPARDGTSADASLTAWLVIRSGAAALLLAAAVRPRAIGLRTAAVVAALSLLVATAIGVVPALAPDLVSPGGLTVDDYSERIPSELTTVWLLLAAVPLAGMFVAAVAVSRRALRDELPAWLGAVTILLAASQAHGTLWPSAYTPVVTSFDLLRGVFTSLLVLFGVLELRRVARRREDALIDARLRAEAHSAAVLASAPEPILVVDDAGRITEANTAADRVFGARLPGRPISDVLPGASGAKDCPRTTWGRRADDELFEAEVSSNPIGAAAPGLHTVVARDVTAAHRADRRRGMQLAVAEAINEASTLGEAAPRVLRAVTTGLESDVAFLWLPEDGRDGSVLACTTAWTAEASLGAFVERRRTTRLRPGEDLPGRVWSDGRPTRVADLAADPQRRHIAADDTPLRFALAFPLATGGEVRGVIEVFGCRRLTGDPDALETTAALGTQIAQFIVRRELEDTLRHLTTAAISRGDFAAALAHELNSPLAAIQAFANVLGRGHLGPEDQARALRAIEQETGLLTSMVADMRHGSAANGADFFPVDRRPVSLPDLLAGAAEFARTLPGSHSIELDVDGAGEVLADPTRISQVLRNLLVNAARYSDPGTPIALRARVVDDRVRVEVEDHGCGIPPDQLPRVFEKFHRGESAARRRVGGLGLGLYVSREIVRCHGSDLTARSRPGEGSTFAFELELPR